MIVRSVLFSMLVMLGVTGNVNAQCVSPTNLQAGYSNNVTTFSWSNVSGATAYVFEAKQSWATWQQIEVLDTVNTNSYSLTGIMQSLNFDWRIKTICQSGVSAYTAANFTIPCPQPSNASVSNITMSSATLNWSPATGYNTYISDFAVAYRPLGSSTWISLGNTSGFTMNVTGLAANTTYEWCANQTCPYANSQPLLDTFTTSGCTRAGSNSGEWIALFKLASINRSSGAETGGYAQTSQSTNLTIGSSRNKASIRAGNSGQFNKQRFSIYIDYNDNNVYESTEVVYGPAVLKNTRTKGFRFNIPSNAPAGTHGMRVIMARQGTTISGCMSGFYGETEDYTVTLTSSGNKGTLSIPTAVAELQELTLYPNPANSELNIQLPAEAVSVTIYDLLGKKVYQQEKPAKDIQINISGWAATQYVAIATYKDGHSEKVQFVKY